MLSDTEIIIIEDAVENALTFGLGILSTVKEQLEFNDLEMTDEIEEYVFQEWIDE